MNKVDENFLKELQEQCFREGAEHIAGYREALARMLKTPNDSLSDMLKACHSIKGTLQASGYLHCSDFVHQLESAITNVLNYLESNKITPAEDDLRVLEFLCSDAIQYLETYFTELKEANTDKPEMVTSRIHSVTIISEWKCGANTESLVDVIPSASDHKEVIPFDEPAKEPDLSTLLDQQIQVAEKVLTEQSRNAPKVVEPDTTLSNLYLLCKNGERYFGIQIERVVEIVQRQKWNSLPSMVDGLSGLMNLRGEVLPVIDMKRTLGDRLMVVSDDKLSRSYIVVCQVSGTKYGFPVEDAQQVLELDTDKFQPADTLQFERDSQMVTHFSLQENKTILILDLNKAFAA